MRTQLFWFFLLIACGDKEPAADTSDSVAEADTDTDADTDVDADTDADTDPHQDTFAELAMGCLDKPCNIFIVGASARRLCEEETGGAVDMQVYWAEQRSLTFGSGGSSYICASSVLTESDCDTICKRGGFTHSFFKPAGGECGCPVEFSEGGALASQMSALVCPDPDTATVTLDVEAYPATAMLAVISTVSCFPDDTRGTKSCEAAMAMANKQLDAGLMDILSTDNTCTMYTE